MSTVTDEMRALAATLLPGSRAQQVMTWAAMELDDRAENIAGLETEIKEYSDGYAGMTKALLLAKLALQDVTNDIHVALWKPEAPARDDSSFKNCMAAHGVEPYAKAKRIKKVTA